MMNMRMLKSTKKILRHDMISISFGENLNPDNKFSFSIKALVIPQKA